jgi:hypothetical protein
LLELKPLLAVPHPTDEAGGAIAVWFKQIRGYIGALRRELSRRAQDETDRFSARAYLGASLSHWDHECRRLAAPSGRLDQRVAAGQ